MPCAAGTPFLDRSRAKLSDHGLPFTYSEPCDEAEASAIYAHTRPGLPPCDTDTLKFRSFTLRFFGQLDADANWTKQLHLGALRNANSRNFKELGPDTGFDSIGDWPQAQPLSRYFDQLESIGKLPKMIIYNLNPNDNYLFAAMIGNFQDGAIAGKLQFGSAWWYLDQKEAMEWQLNALSNIGLLSRFVGMLTELSELHVLSATRIFSTGPLQFAWTGEWTVAKSRWTKNCLATW